MQDRENLEDTKKHEPDATPYQYFAFSEPAGSGSSRTAPRCVQHGCKAKGGELAHEILPFRNQAISMDLKDHFKEEFFETKKVVYVPL